MPKYKVHIFPVVRVAVEVEAESSYSAVKKALEEFDNNSQSIIDEQAQYAYEIQQKVVVDVFNANSGVFEQNSVRNLDGGNVH